MVSKEAFVLVKANSSSNTGAAKPTRPRYHMELLEHAAEIWYTRDLHHALRG